MTRADVMGPEAFMTNGTTQAPPASMEISSTTGEGPTASSGSVKIQANDNTIRYLGDKMFTRESVTTDNPRASVVKEAIDYDAAGKSYYTSDHGPAETTTTRAGAERVAPATETRDGASSPGAETWEEVEDDARANALDLDKLNVRDPSKVLGLPLSILETADAEITTTRTPDGRRDLDVKFEIAGGTFHFKGEDLADLNNLGARANDLTDPVTDAVSGATGGGGSGGSGGSGGGGTGGGTGGESVEPNGSGFVARSRFSSLDDRDDAIDSDNRNTLVQTKAGFIVITAAEVNINFGANGTFALFVA